MGSQAEAEWRGIQPRGVAHVFNDTGYDVPDVYREHRAGFDNSKPKDLDAYRRVLNYRAGHIGTKELEIILRDYMTLYGAGMTYNDLEEFDKDVLSMENPSLQRYLMNGDPLAPEHNTKYMRLLVTYVNNRMRNYKEYKPREPVL